MDMIEVNAVVRSCAASLLYDKMRVPEKSVKSGMSLLRGLPLPEREKNKQPDDASRIFLRMLNLFSSDVPPADTESLCYVHRTLFRDVRPNSGTLRKKNLELKGNTFTDFKLLSGSLKTVLGKMDAVGCSPELGKPDFVALLAHYMRELNILSPFEYGNGITRRTFAALFCLRHGFFLDYSRVKAKDFVRADTLAFATDDTQSLYACLMDATSYHIPSQSIDTSRRKPAIAESSAALLGKRPFSSAKKSAIVKEVLPSSPTKTVQDEGFSPPAETTTKPENTAQKNEYTVLQTHIATIRKHVDTLEAELDELTNLLDAYNKRG